MKRYKLIREYPGSPRLGTEITQLECDSIECYPEFWEEVVEKDYEILSFKRNGNFMSIEQKKLATLQKDGSYLHIKLLSTIGGATLEFMLKNSFYNIHSVKRLSDGEIFTVGDKINYKVVSTSKRKRTLTSKINSFYIDLNNNLRVNFDLDRINTSTNCHLNDLLKVKNPLFRTEDGVEIFEGDKTCWINNWTVTNFADWKRNNNEKELHFSTKEAAEEYILMNKPCLSLNDVFEVYPEFKKEDPVNKRTFHAEKLINLVKSKL